MVIKLPPVFFKTDGDPTLIQLPLMSKTKGHPVTKFYFKLLVIIERIRKHQLIDEQEGGTIDRTYDLWVETIMLSLGQRNHGFPWSLQWHPGEMGVHEKTFIKVLEMAIKVHSQFIMSVQEISCALFMMAKLHDRHFTHNIFHIYLLHKSVVFWFKFTSSCSQGHN